MDYSFDYSPSYDFNFDTSYLNMSVGTAGYYTPPADFSGGTSQMSYAGGQNYEGESGEWGASGAYCGDSYSSYMSAQYGALGESIANQQLGHEIPLSWYENDVYWQYAQYGAAGIGVGAGLGAVYLGAAAAGPAIYSYLSGFGTSAAASPELVAAGAGAAQYGVQKAPELESLVPEVSSVGAEGGALVNNPIPETLARVIPGNVNPTMLGLGEDVFVTDAAALRGLNAGQISEALGIPESASGFRVYEFASQGLEIASPVNRLNPGFFGQGLTSGGLPEFVIPNAPIPASSMVWFTY